MHLNMYTCIYIPLHGFEKQKMLGEIFIIFLKSKTIIIMQMYISSVENQKGTITIQRYSIENQKGAITIDFLQR